MILYVKYNKERKKQYQLVTTIEKIGGNLFSYKKALAGEAVEFLDSFFGKYRYLKKENFPIKPLKPEKDGNAVRFDYIGEKSLDTLIAEAVLKKDRQAILDVFLEYKDIIDKIQTETTLLSKGFEEFFGKQLKREKVECLTTGCFDLIAENIFKNKGKYFLLDYEWTFDFPVPKKFVFYRNITTSFAKYFQNDINQLVSAKELFAEFGITEKDKKDFFEFEWNFQEKINESMISRKEARILLETVLYGQFKIVETVFDKYESVKSEKASLERVSEERLDNIRRLEGAVKERDERIMAMEFSKFWKLRSVYLKVRKLGPRNLYRLSKRFIRAVKRNGISLFIKKFIYIVHYGRGGRDYAEYTHWIKLNEKINLKAVRKEIEDFRHKPKISIIVPVYNVPAKWLNKCIESVVNQYYPNWELCLHDDLSTEKETVECLKKWGKSDDRIKVSYGKTNQHISGASNEALKLATGEFIALMDNDDELTPNALYENVKLLNVHPEADMIYSDEDKYGPDGKRTQAFFKPDWTPDLMLSEMYTCHLGVYRKSIIDKIGGFRKGYEGAQDHDLVLRFVEKTTPEKIFHIPKILYRWRMIPSSTASAASSKDYATIAGLKTVNDYLKRNGIRGEAVQGPGPGHYRVVREIIDSPKVSIIIPFKDEAKVLKRCIESILTKTDYENYEILLINNNSQKKNTQEYLDEIRANPKIKIYDYKKPFNYSSMNNYAVKKADSEYILLLNNDTEVISGGWLRAMLEHAQRPEVGAVGAKLLYPNGLVQHAGVILGVNTADHAFKFCADGDMRQNRQLDSIRNYSAVTAACLMTRKGLYQSVGGLDEGNLKVAYQDLDFCLKLREKGYLIVYTPYAELFHYEGLSRDDDGQKEKKDPERYREFMKERDFFAKKWEKYIDRDPYYNPNYSTEEAKFNTSIKKVKYEL